LGESPEADYTILMGATTYRGRERIYDGYPDVALDMTSSRTFDGRTQLLEYVPTILAGRRAPTRTRDSRVAGAPTSVLVAKTCRKRARSRARKPLGAM
jgi:hypothetical protein